MADHVRSCKCCKAGKNCDTALQIISSYSFETLIDALEESMPRRFDHEVKHPATDKEYWREFRRKYMRLKRTRVTFPHFHK